MITCTIFSGRELEIIDKRDSMILSARGVKVSQALYGVKGVLLVPLSPSQIMYSSARTLSFRKLDRIFQFHNRTGAVPPPPLLVLAISA